VAGFGVVAEVRKTLGDLADTGGFDQSFYDKCVKHFTYDSEIADPTVVILLSVPRPAHYVTFSLDDKQLTAVIPPTYAHYYEVSKRVRAEMQTAGILKPGRRLAPLRAPLKSVAARVGLVRYGRNNITYTKSHGSYQQIVGVASDAPPSDFALDAVLDSPGLAEECLRCRACARVCPTRAIPDDRFLLRGERCLTFLNEFKGEWPEWLDHGCHNALIGCMTCQMCCPANANRHRTEDTGVSFSESETARLLSGDPLPPGAWDDFDAKFSAAGLVEYDQDIVRRNLRALVRAQGC
jgi:epoxyqueuosine reductase